MHRSCQLLFMFLLSGSVWTGGKWSFRGKNGPESWGKSYPKCAGARQSPILIETKNVIYDSSLTGFTLTNFDNRDSSLNWTLINDGHVACVKVVSGAMTITGGGLDGPYRVFKFHFHWGANSSRGSEHRVDDKSFPMEMHVVSYKAAYNNYTNALNYVDGVAVLASFFEIAGTEHATFAKVVARLPEVRKESSDVPIDVFNLLDLMPAERSKYYRYLGSLTTPECFEAVIWTVFQQTIKISEAQVSAFRTLTEGKLVNETFPLIDNFRPVQPLRGRQVRATTASTGSFCGLALSAELMLLSHLLFAFLLE
ncbi:carbonic anhydrase 7-like [Pomacea canaliculata]|uniref:carbonic anhydrase 7-like n=1 Tax=Pomacea canaliculata TaxID=400727 RepID=UPI000D734FAA|nr:carbonic anhydrase 7-like [Pomacea canaliculata]